MGFWSFVPSVDILLCFVLYTFIVFWTGFVGAYQFCA